MRPAIIVSVFFATIAVALPLTEGTEGLAVRAEGVNPQSHVIARTEDEDEKKHHHHHNHPPRDVEEEDDDDKKHHHHHHPPSA